MQQGIQFPWILALKWLTQKQSPIPTNQIPHLDIHFKQFLRRDKFLKFLNKKPIQLEKSLLMRKYPPIQERIGIRVPQIFLQEGALST